MNEVLNTIARIKALMRNRLTRVISTGGRAVDLDSFHHGLNQYHKVFEQVLDDLEAEIRKGLRDRKSPANDPRFVYGKHPKTVERLLEENLEIVRKDYEKLLDSKTLKAYEFGKQVGSFEARLEKHYGKDHRDSRDLRRDQATGVDFKKAEPAVDSEKSDRVEPVERAESGWFLHGFSSFQPVRAGACVDIVARSDGDESEEVWHNVIAESVRWERVHRWRFSREAGENNEDEAKDAES